MLLKCEHFVASSGEQSARVYVNSSVRLLHSAIKPEQEREWFKPKQISRVIFAYGTGLGYHLEFLQKKSQNIDLIILCDAFAENISVVKEKLKGLPIVLFNEDLSKYENILKNNKITVMRLPSAARYCENEAEKTLQDIFKIKRNTVAKNNGKIEDYTIAVPFGTHFLQQEIINALKELQIKYIILPQNSENPSMTEDNLTEQFQKLLPDFLLCVNAKGIDSEGVLLNVCKRFSIPVYIWFVDDPRPIACLFNKAQCQNIIAYTWEKAYIPWLKEKGFSDAKYLPLAGDTNLFYAKNNTPIYNLMFTGSAMAGEFLARIWDRISYNKEEALPIAQDAAYKILTGELRAEQLPGDNKDEAWFASYCIHLASAEKRRLCLEPLLELGLQFAGDKEGWKNLFGGNIKTLSDIDYRNSLCLHYSKGNIHINITSCQMPSAVNQRVFDIVLCNRFVINDNQDDLFELFPKSAVCAASSPEEYAELAKFYFKNENAKNEIIKKAKEHILKEHLYKHRIKEILSD